MRKHYPNIFLILIFTFTFAISAQDQSDIYSILLDAKPDFYSGVSEIKEKDTLNDIEIQETLELLKAAFDGTGITVFKKSTDKQSPLTAKIFVYSRGALFIPTTYSISYILSTDIRYSNKSVTYVSKSQEKRITVGLGEFKQKVGTEIKDNALNEIQSLCTKYSNYYAEWIKQAQEYFESEAQDKGAYIKGFTSILDTIVKKYTLKSASVYVNNVRPDVLSIQIPASLGITSIQKEAFGIYKKDAAVCDHIVINTAYKVIKLLNETDENEWLLLAQTKQEYRYGSMQPGQFVCLKVSKSEFNRFMNELKEKMFGKDWENHWAYRKIIDDGGAFGVERVLNQELFIVGCFNPSGDTELTDGNGNALMRRTIRVFKMSQSVNKW